MLAEATKSLRAAQRLIEHAVALLTTLNEALESRYVAKLTKIYVRASERLSQVILLVPRLHSDKHAAEVQDNIAMVEEILGGGGLEDFDELGSKAFARVTTAIATASDHLSEVDLEADYIEENPTDDNDVEDVEDDEG
jgi:hypothetical protein